MSLERGQEDACLWPWRLGGLLRELGMGGGLLGWGEWDLLF